MQKLIDIIRDIITNRTNTFLNIIALQNLLKAKYTLEQYKAFLNFMFLGVLRFSKIYCGPNKL